MPQVFKGFKAMAKLQLGYKLKALQTDCGKEFLSLASFLIFYGIKLHDSCPHTHQQNGVVERKHKHLVDTTLSMLAYATMPLKYWDMTVVSTCHLINILSSSVLSGLSLHKVLFKNKPSYNNLRVFGSLCFPNMKPYNSHKFDFRSIPCTFIGYSIKFKGYKCLISIEEVIYSRHILLDENKFLFSSKKCY